MRSSITRSMCSENPEPGDIPPPNSLRALQSQGDDADRHPFRNSRLAGLLSASVCHGLVERIGIVNRINTWSNAQGVRFTDSATSIQAIQIHIKVVRFMPLLSLVGTIALSHQDELSFEPCEWQLLPKQVNDQDVGFLLEDGSPAARPPVPERDS